MSISYTPPGTGAVETTVGAELNQYLSVGTGYGADTTGVADSTAAFTKVGSIYAAQVVDVPAGTYLLNSNPTPTGKVLWGLHDGASLTGTGNNVIGDTSGAMLQYLQQGTDGTTDFASLYVRRNASHTGGTSGRTIAAIRADTFIANNAINDYEWALTGVVWNSSSGTGQMVGLIGYGFKRVAAASPTWGSNIGIFELVPINNPATGSVGLEVDVASNGTDTSNKRIGIHVVCLRQNPTGAGAQCGYGIVVDNNSDTNSFIGTGVALKSAGLSPAFDYGFDTSSATIAIGAFRMAAGQTILFDAPGINQLFFDGTIQGLTYKVSGTGKATLLASGGISMTGAAHTVDITGALGTSSSTTPALTSNKPGASTAIGAWINVMIDGNQYWIPAWSD